MVRDAIAAKLTGGRFTLIAVVLVAVLLGPAAGEAMAEANFLGTWIPSPGQPWTITSQSGGSCTGTTSLGAGWTFEGCHVNGNEYEFTVAEPSIEYSSRNHGTINGNSLEGEFNDTYGHDVPYKAVREAGASISGEILDQNYKAVTGVTVKLTGTSEGGEPVSQTTKTGAAGKYSFEPQPGTYTLTAAATPTSRTGAPWRS